MSTFNDPDVVVIGAGGDGPACAQRLGERGVTTLVLEAGPWYGNTKWEHPTEEPADGKHYSADPADLDGSLLDDQFSTRELEMIEKLTWGPADIERPVWFREQPQDGLIIQIAGVGGTTLHYTGCHPRAYPSAFDEQGLAAGGEGWLIDYDDLAEKGPSGSERSYYRTVEDHVHVHRLDAGPSAIHIHSTMRMGFVADEACEAYDVDRLFIADHSVLPNGLGGPNPTNTGQALAMRTGDRIADRYFGG